MPLVWSSTLTAEGAAVYAGKGNIGRPKEDRPVECLARLKFGVVFVHRLFVCTGRVSAAQEIYRKCKADLAARKRL